MHVGVGLFHASALWRPVKNATNAVVRVRSLMRGKPMANAEHLRQGVDVWNEVE